MIALSPEVRKHFLRGAISIDVRLFDRGSVFKIRIAPRKRARRKAAGAFLKRGRQVSTPFFAPPSISNHSRYGTTFLSVAGFDVAERQSTLDCRVRWWPTGTALAVECGAASIALDIHFEDGGVMDEAVDGCQRHSLVWKHLAPFAERLIGGDQH